MPATSPAPITPAAASCGLGPPESATIGLSAATQSSRRNSRDGTDSVQNCTSRSAPRCRHSGALSTHSGQKRGS
jgi:hypothetical protein